MDSKCTVLILGASIYQVPLIRKAHEMGLRVIAASIRGNYPGFRIADEVWYIDTTDADGILKAARNANIDGILTTGTDVAVRSIGHTCDALGLPGISERAARFVTDKTLMKQAFKAGGVNTSPFHIVSTVREAISAAEEIGYPVMVKACDVSGSRGISKVNSQYEVSSAFDAAMRATRKDYVIVEGFVSGYEIGVSGFISGGELLLFAPHKKFVRRIGPVTVPEGHAFPFECTPEVYDEVRHQLELAIAATGIDDCAVNGDFMIGDDGSVSVIEIGGRCGATCIPELISIHFGIDYYEMMIRAALGKEIQAPAGGTMPCMAKLLFSPVEGVVTDIDYDGLDKLRESHPGATILLDVEKGDFIRKTCDGTDRWGHVIMETAREEDVDEMIQAVRRCVHTS